MLRILPSPLAMISLAIVLVLALVASMLKLSFSSDADPILQAQVPGATVAGEPGASAPGGGRGRGGREVGAPEPGSKAQAGGQAASGGGAASDGRVAGGQVPGGVGAAGAPGGSGDIVVQVSGAVVRPSVVTVPAGSRGIDAVQKAGGLTKDADLSSINLAQVLTDGQHLHVLKQGEAAAPGVAQQGAAGPAGAAGNGCVDVKTASEDDLETLDGIGPTLAKRIVDYRTQNGFTSAEDVQNVPGIGPKKYDALKGQLCQ